MAACTPGGTKVGPAKLLASTRLFGVSVSIDIAAPFGEKLFVVATRIDPLPVAVAHPRVPDRPGGAGRGGSRMTHLSFIVAAYALAVLVPAGYALAAASRLRAAQRRLAALDTRRRGSR
jgi:hypothetical protein